MGGDPGADLFEAHDELTALFRDLNTYSGAVELVLAGDIFDLLRIGTVAEGQDRVSMVLAQPAYADLVEAWRSFAAQPTHRVIYLPGNHDVEVWWNRHVRTALVRAGLVHEFALSYGARYRSMPERLIFCEHGNQLDRSNARKDYGDRSESPLGDHIVADLMRPIAPRAHLTRAIPLRDLPNVYPLTQVPEWLAGRLFYDLVGRAVTLVVLPLLVLLAAVPLVAWLIGLLQGRALDASGVQSILTEVALNVLVLLAAFLLIFAIVRRALRRSIGFIAPHLAGIDEGMASLERVEALKDLDEPVPNRRDVTYRDIDVFVWGHSHAPTLKVIRRESRTGIGIVANAGCWLRQLHPIRAHLWAPPVFVARFVLTHVRVTCSPEGLRAELWEHVRRAPQRLLWTERLAVFGRVRADGDPEGSRLVASGTLPPTRASDGELPSAAR
jgi:hypothetical protein